MKTFRHFPRRSIAIHTVLLWSLVAPGVRAQTPSRASLSRSDLCWLHPDVSRCRNILVTEGSLAPRMTRSAVSVQFPRYDHAGLLNPVTIEFEGPGGGVELAFLHAIDERTAIGPTVQFSTLDVHRRIGIRLRREFREYTVVEAIGGVIRGDPGELSYAGNHGEVTGISIGAQVINPRIVGFGVRYDDMPWPELTNGSVYAKRSGRARSMSWVVTGSPAVSGVAIVLGVIVFVVAMSGMGD